MSRNIIERYIRATCRMGVTQTFVVPFLKLEGSSVVTVHPYRAVILTHPIGVDHDVIVLDVDL